MRTIVVTGGIGSGKSAVCRILRERYGLAVYEADAAVKRLYGSHPHLLDSIGEALGTDLRDGAGDFVPGLLAERIFSDREALDMVENLVFPALKEDFAAFAGLHRTDPYVVFESATVLEKRQFDGFGDVVVLVDAPFEVRLARAVSRDSASEESVRLRMSRQSLMNALSEGMTDPRIDYVIVNDGTLSHLEHQVSVMMDGLK